MAYQMAATAMTLNDLEGSHSYSRRLPTLFEFLRAVSLR